jgi:PKD repeat protein
MITMRINGIPARGRPLALFLLVLALTAVPLLAEDAPCLQVHQLLDSQEIYVAGTGSPDTATLNLAVEGVGPDGRFPIDCLLVIDVSATAQLTQAKQVAFDLISTLSSQDRIGVVSFATTARLNVPLHGDQYRLKSAVADLETSGKSAFGDALQLARQELLRNGRPDAVLVEVLLTDGQSNTGRDPEGEGEVAKEAGIKIVPIGIGTLINRNLLEEFATKTGGRFFERPDERTAEEIQDLLTVTSVAHDVRVEKILPASIHYLGASPAPTRVTEKLDGTTSLIWEIGEVDLGERWQTEITVEARTKGTWTTDQGSTISYTDFRGVENQILVPAWSITAIVPPAPPAPPVAGFSYEPLSPSTTDLISFKDQSRDEDGDVVSWAWDFGDGTRSAEQNPEYSYSHSGTYNITLIVTDDEGYVSDPVEQTVTVKNTGPMAMFDVIPDKPRVAAETVFDASKAYDADGRVVSYAWDFDGDGLFDLTTASSEATHTFLEAGEVPVVLKVTDDEGGVSVIKEIVEVLPSVIVERTIETCLPGDETIVDGVVTVTVTITINTEIHGLTLHEEIPEGWTFTEVDNSSATFRKDTLDWLFLETLVDGDKRVIQYTLTAPSSCTNSETLTVSLNGLVQSSSPRLSQMVLGDDKVALATVLPIPVVISRWDSAQEKIDLCLPEQISFDQLQYAVSLWLDGGTVPYTGDQVITLDVIRDLIAYWLTNTSVHDPLP